MIINPSSAALTTTPAIESDDKPAAPSPQPRAADVFKKLRRLLGFIYLKGPTKCTILYGLTIQPAIDKPRQGVVANAVRLSLTTIALRFG